MNVNAGRRPFAGIEDQEIGLKRDPFLAPKDVRRDLSLPPDRNIVSASPAKYILAIDKCEYSGSRRKGDFFRVKFTVEWADGPNAVGSSCVWMCRQQSDFFLRDVKAFACNAMNAPAGAFKESDFEAMVSAQQPITALKRRVCVTVENVKGKEPPYKDFTRHAWEPIEVVWNPDGSVGGYKQPEKNNVVNQAA